MTSRAIEHPMNSKKIQYTRYSILPDLPSSERDAVNDDQDREQHQKADRKPDPTRSLLSQFDASIRVATVPWATH